MDVGTDPSLQTRQLNEQGKIEDRLSGHRMDVMLDPSLLYVSRPEQREGLVAYVARYVDEFGEVVVPGSFYDAVLEGTLEPSSAARLLGGGGRSRRQSEDADEARAQTGEAERFWRETAADLGSLLQSLPVRPFVADGRRGEFFPGEMRIASRDPLVERVTVEEWIFLQSHSLLASHLKRPFIAFVRAGAASVEVGSRALKRLEQRTLRLSPAEAAHLTAVQHLRAAAKWIAAGGSVATALVNPLVGIPLGAAASWFLLLDP